MSDTDRYRGLIKWLRYERLDGKPEAEYRREAATAIESLVADNERLVKNYAEGLEAWKANNAFFGGWCERFMKELDKYQDAWEPDFSPVSQAMDEYKAARAGR